MGADTATRVMAIATGETRPITQTWPSGHFTCPWCAAANEPNAEKCENPACWASKWANAGQVRAEQERRAAAQREAEARRATNEQAMQAVAARQAADSRKWTALQAEAEQRGACVTCLRKSDWRYRPRLVKHRNADFHATP